MRHPGIVIFALTLANSFGCALDHDDRTDPERNLVDADYNPLVDGEPQVEPLEELTAHSNAAAACPPWGQVLGGWGFCSNICKCSAGQGDCDAESHCANGLVCVEDVGADYGWAWNVDVCEDPNGSAGEGEGENGAQPLEGTLNCGCSDIECWCDASAAGGCGGYAYGSWDYVYDGSQGMLFSSGDTADVTFYNNCDPDLNHTISVVVTDACGNSDSMWIDMDPLC